jgi:hypothetical protein
MNGVAMQDHIVSIVSHNLLMPNAHSITCHVLSGMIMQAVFRLLEVGGTEFDFNGNEKGCDLQCKLHIIRPAFYWKVSNFHLVYHNHLLDVRDYSVLVIGLVA